MALRAEGCEQIRQRAAVVWVGPALNVAGLLELLHGCGHRLLEETFARTGATILGKRMFDGGERFWPEEAPFHTPVYVLTTQRRDPWERPGGTTFYFVNDGIESALRQAREAAGGRDIRIGGGANTIVQYLNAGLVDEFTVSIASE